MFPVFLPDGLVPMVSPPSGTATVMPLEIKIPAIQLVAFLRNQVHLNATLNTSTLFATAVSGSSLPSISSEM